jgi:hypothetical protein
VGKAKKNTPKPRKRGKAAKAADDKRTPSPLNPKRMEEWLRRRWLMFSDYSPIYREPPYPRATPLPNPPAVPVPLKSAKEWIPELVKPVHKELVAIGTTKASHWVASRAPADGKPVKPRSAEKILRNYCGFPKANRGSSKQHPE